MRLLSSGWKQGAKARSEREGTEEVVYRKHVSEFMFIGRLARLGMTS
jgi:hypothetical protein